MFLGVREEDMKKLGTFLLLGCASLLQCSGGQPRATREELLYGNVALPAGQIDTPNEVALSILANAIAENRNDDAITCARAFGYGILLCAHPTTGRTPLQVATDSGNRPMVNVINTLLDRQLRASMRDLNIR
jgi:hypothetical protein